MRIYSSAFAAAILSLLSSCGKPQPAAAPPPKPASSSGTVSIPSDSPLLTRIRVEAIQSKRVALDEVVAPGKIESNPNRISRVSMPVAGRVKRVMVGIGDSVNQEQALIAIDSPEIGAAISSYRQGQARVSQTEAALAKAEADLARAQDLFANRAVAQKEVLSAQASLALAKSDLQQVQAGLEETGRKFRLYGLSPEDRNPEILVRAPLSGKIMEIGVAAGEYRNDTSAPLLTIADLSSVYMAADVPETQIRLIHKGEAVAITLAAYPGEVIPAQVMRIADIVDAQSRTIKVRAEMKNPGGRFRPDMFGEIRHEETFREVPLVPAGAVIQSDKRSIVWREKSAGEFEAVTVTFSRQVDGRVPILSGLKAGDRIVTDGAMLLQGNR